MKSTSKYLRHLGHLHEALVFASLSIISFPSSHQGQIASYGNSTGGIVAYNSFIISIILAASAQKEAHGAATDLKIRVFLLSHMNLHELSYAVEVTATVLLFTLRVLCHIAEQSVGRQFSRLPLRPNDRVRTDEGNCLILGASLIRVSLPPIRTRKCRVAKTPHRCKSNKHLSFPA